MNILAACGGPDSPVRKVVFKSSAHYYGCERDDPAFFTEAMQRPHPPRTRLESDIVEAENAVRGLRRAQPGRHGDGAALRQRARPGPATPRTATCCGCPRSRASSASTRATSSSTRTTSSACSSTRSPTTCPASSTSPATACWCCRRSRACSGRPLAPILPPWGTGAGHRRAAARRRADPRRDGPAAALRPRPGQPQAQGRRLPAALHDPRGGLRSSARTCACASCGGRGARRIATSARSRSSCATARASAAGASRERRVRKLTWQNACSYSSGRIPCVQLDAAPHASPLPRSHRHPRRRTARHGRGRLRVRPGQGRADRRGHQGQRRRRRRA